MRAYLLRRGASFVMTLWLASTLTYLALLVIPGDPARLILGLEARPEAVAAVRSQLGLDQPPFTRYLRWLGQLVTLDLGESITYGLPVTHLLRERLAVTVPMAAMALGVALSLGVPSGLVAAVRRGSFADAAVSFLAQLGMATPSFWLGIFLMVVFAVRLQWFPAGGFVPWSQDVATAFLSLILPAVAVGVAKAASLARVVRTAVLETLAADYVRTAHAKGLTPGRVLWRHALRNALVSVFTVLGNELIQLLAGSMVVESVFALPGLGTLALTAVYNRDLPLVQGIVVTLATTVLAVSFLLDVAYGWLDPRIRYR